MEWWVVLHKRYIAGLQRTASDNTGMQPLVDKDAEQGRLGDLLDPVVGNRITMGYNNII